MKAKITHRAWYKRFLYKASCVYQSRKELPRIKTWLNSHGVEYKIRRYNTRVIVFFLDSGHFQNFLTEFHDSVEEFYRPLSAAAGDLLVENCDIEIRKNLLWGKYRYRVTWPGVYRGRNAACHDFIVNHLPDVNDYAWHNGGWEEHLYLRDKHHIMMLKMCVDPGKYRKVLSVVLETEVT